MPKPENAVGYLNPFNYNHVFGFFDKIRAEDFMATSGGMIAKKRKETTQTVDGKTTTTVDDNARFTVEDFKKAVNFDQVKGLSKEKRQKELGGAIRFRHSGLFGDGGLKLGRIWSLIPYSMRTSVSDPEHNKKLRATLAQAIKDDFCGLTVSDSILNEILRNGSGANPNNTTGLMKVDELFDILDRNDTKKNNADFRRTVAADILSKAIRDAVGLTMDLSADGIKSLFDTCFGKGCENTFSIQSGNELITVSSLDDLFKACGLPAGAQDCSGTPFEVFASKLKNAAQTLKTALRSQMLNNALGSLVDKASKGKWSFQTNDLRPVDLENLYDVFNSTLHLTRDYEQIRNFFKANKNIDQTGPGTFYTALRTYVEKVLPHQLDRMSKQVNVNVSDMVGNIMTSACKFVLGYLKQSTEPNLVPSVLNEVRKDFQDVVKKEADDFEKELNEVLKNAGLSDNKQSEPRPENLKIDDLKKQLDAYKQNLGTSESKLKDLMAKKPAAESETSNTAKFELEINDLTREISVLKAKIDGVNKQIGAVESKEKGQTLLDVGGIYLDCQCEFYADYIVEQEKNRAQGPADTGDVKNTGDDKNTEADEKAKFTAFLKEKLKSQNGEPSEFENRIVGRLNTRAWELFRAIVINSRSETMVGDCDMINIALNEMDYVMATNSRYSVETEPEFKVYDNDFRLQQTTFANKVAELLGNAKNKVEVGLNVVNFLSGNKGVWDTTKDIFHILFSKNKSTKPIDFLNHLMKSSRERLFNVAFDSSYETSLVSVVRQTLLNSKFLGESADPAKGDIKSAIKEVGSKAANYSGLDLPNRAKMVKAKELGQNILSLTDSIRTVFDNRVYGKELFGFTVAGYESFKMEKEVEEIAKKLSLQQLRSLAHYSEPLLDNGKSPAVEYSEKQQKEILAKMVRLQFVRSMHAFLENRVIEFCRDLPNHDKYCTGVKTGKAVLSEAGKAALCQLISDGALMMRDDFISALANRCAYSVSDVNQGITGIIPSQDLEGVSFDAKPYTVDNTTFGAMEELRKSIFSNVCADQKSYEATYPFLAKIYAYGGTEGENLGSLSQKIVIETMKRTHDRMVLSYSSYTNDNKLSSAGRIEKFRKDFAENAKKDVTKQLKDINAFLQSVQKGAQERFMSEVRSLLENNKTKMDETNSRLKMYLDCGLLVKNQNGGVELACEQKALESLAGELASREMIGSQSVLKFVQEHIGHPTFLESGYSKNFQAELLFKFNGAEFMDVGDTMLPKVKAEIEGWVEGLKGGDGPLAYSKENLTAVLGKEIVDTLDLNDNLKAFYNTCLEKVLKEVADRPFDYWGVGLNDGKGNNPRLEAVKANLKVQLETFGVKYQTFVKEKVGETLLEKATGEAEKQTVGLEKLVKKGDVVKAVVSQGSVDSNDLVDSLVGKSSNMAERKVTESKVNGEKGMKTAQAAAEKAVAELLEKDNEIASVINGNNYKTEIVNKLAHLIIEQGEDAARKQIEETIKAVRQNLNDFGTNAIKDSNVVSEENIPAVKDYLKSLPEGDAKTLKCPTESLIRTTIVDKLDIKNFDVGNDRAAINSVKEAIKAKVTVWQNQQNEKLKAQEKEKMEEERVASAIATVKTKVRERFAAWTWDWDAIPQAEGIKVDVKALIENLTEEIGSKKARANDNVDDIVQACQNEILSRILTRVAEKFTATVVEGSKLDIAGKKAPNMFSEMFIMDHAKKAFAGFKDDAKTYFTGNFVQGYNKNTDNQKSLSGFWEKMVVVYGQRNKFVQMQLGRTDKALSLMYERFEKNMDMEKGLGNRIRDYFCEYAVNCNYAKATSGWLFSSGPLYGTKNKAKKIAFDTAFKEVPGLLAEKVFESLKETNFQGMNATFAMESSENQVSNGYLGRMITFYQYIVNIQDDTVNDLLKRQLELRKELDSLQVLSDYLNGLKGKNIADLQKKKVNTDDALKKCKKNLDGCKNQLAEATVKFMKSGKAWNLTKFWEYYKECHSGSKRGKGGNAEDVQRQFSDFLWSLSSVSANLDEEIDGYGDLVEIYSRHSKDTLTKEQEMNLWSKLKAAVGVPEREKTTIASYLCLDSQFEPYLSTYLQQRLEDPREGIGKVFREFRSDYGIGLAIS